MGVRVYKPTSPGRRGMSGYDFSEITKGEPEKSLTEPLKKTGGRNSQGRITVRHRGGGHKRRYRVMDFRRDKDGIPARVAAIEYDPNRTARIALLHYADGEKRYILCPKGVQVGDVLRSGPDAEIRPGNALPLERIPLGSIVHAVELKPGGGARIARSAGTGCQVLAREGKFVHLKLPSGEIRLVHAACKATLGEVGNAEHELVSWGKAGRKRWLGWRPSVRGVAMNPVDHPLGGGEGRSSGGRPACSPWGKVEKPTRKKKKPSGKYILKRRER